MRHRFQASFRRACSCTFWRLWYRQSSFSHAARVPQHARFIRLNTTVAFLACYGPPSPFRIEVSHQTQEPPFEFLPAAPGI